MKFKYKKMIVMISMGTMLIGCVIFSTVNSKSKPANNTKTVEQAEPEASPAAASVDTTVIQKDLNQEVTNVVKEYLTASVACDMDALEETVNDISLVDEQALKVKYEYVESVSNIECYMIPGPDEGGYLVYVYRDLKLKDVDTLAPGLSRVYVKTGDNGEFRVYFGADTGLEDFITTTDASPEVTELVNKVNTKMEEAVSSDADLKAFMEKISVENSNENTEAENAETENADKASDSKDSESKDSKSKDNKSKETSDKKENTSNTKE